MLSNETAHLLFGPVMFGLLASALSTAALAYNHFVGTGGIFKSGMPWKPIGRSVAQTAASAGRGVPRAANAGSWIFGQHISDVAAQFVGLGTGRLATSAGRQDVLQIPPSISFFPLGFSSTSKDLIMSNQVITLLEHAIAFVEKAAPGLEQTLVNDAKDAFAKAEAAFAPVADAAAADVIALINTKYPLNTPLTTAEIVFVQAAIAKLAAMLPVIS